MMQACETLSEAWPELHRHQTNDPRMKHPIEMVFRLHEEASIANATPTPTGRKSTGRCMSLSESSGTVAWVANPKSSDRAPKARRSRKIRDLNELREIDPARLSS
jgi:hypothetical protein